MSAGWVPTHRITFAPAGGEARSWDVMLADGVGYTRDEWGACTRADWELVDGQWLCQGRLCPSASGETTPGVVSAVELCPGCGGTGQVAAPDAAGGVAECSWGDCGGSGLLAPETDLVRRHLEILDTEDERRASAIELATPDNLPRWIPLRTAWGHRGRARYRGQRRARVWDRHFPAVLRGGAALHEWYLAEQAAYQCACDAQRAEANAETERVCAAAGAEHAVEMRHR